MNLRFAYSPALLPHLSHLRILLNGELVKVLPLPREEAGREILREIEIDPRYFSDYNRLDIQLIGHYTEECQDDMHSSLWATLSHQSELRIAYRPVELKTDLSLLPAPFFDHRDNRLANIPFVFAHQPPVDLLRQAGVVASWFGALAGYRGARFPVLYNQLPETNAAVFAINGQTVAGLALPQVDQPTVTIIDHPTRPTAKLLLVLGRHSEDLRQAAEGLTLGQVLLSGRSAVVNAVRIEERRKPNDAPNFIRTDRPVKFAELVANSGELQVSGHSPTPVRINLRLPADLMTWHSRGVPIDLKYRYTPPVSQDNSTLAVNLNEKFVQSFRLKPSGLEGEKNRLLLPLNDDGSLQGRDELLLPSFQVGADNQLQFQFTIDYHQQGRCKDTLTDSLRGAIDPESTIDLSSFPHYTAMPNLALYANAGFPFSKYADLAETAVVLPDGFSAIDVEQAFHALGRLGRMTGLPGLRYALVTNAEVEKVRDRDLLVIDRGLPGDFLAHHGRSLPVTLNEVGRVLSPLAIAHDFTELWMGNKGRQAPSETRWQVDIRSGAGLAAMLGFASPFGGERSVVALTSTDAVSGHRIADALDDSGKVRRLRGDVVLLGEQNIDSFQIQESYFVGELPWWMWIWFHLARYPALIAVLGIAGGMLVAIWLYFTLRAMARRRLGRDPV